ncbi:hypothetical protein SAXI111661_21740 [Saccharomonospora xinjiangensis]|uniref:hypothetical protein n=1 Tax=Saccharomonospora xinjiangensis TaxID=75294 RepID=UPI0010704647|nr:hypothetical protein [Saccharomonospora xinjiangensis]QBQ62500.1 hypothetical protein EYD13_20855 [Saccharomonospora xinjiangensis]
MRKRRITLAAAVAALGLGLTACGDTESGAAQSTDTAKSESNSTSASPTSSEAPATEAKPSGGAASGETTAPGTELKVGETATVPFTYGTEKSGTIAITVTAIEQGDSADLAAFGDRAKGLVPYFIKFKVENVEGTDLSYSSVRLRATAADGRGTGVVISGDVEGKCESETASRDFTTAGASYESCALQASSEGIEVVGAEFSDSDDYLDDPIVWTK